MARCAEPRKSEQGTWITQEMLDAYIHLHELGVAHSVEVWLGDDLAGLRAIVEAANRDTGWGWYRLRWKLGILERDFDAVIRFLDELPDDTLDIELKADFHAITYQLAGQPDLAEPYFEIAKDYLEQRLAGQYFPDNTSCGE